MAPAPSPTRVAPGGTGFQPVPAGILPAGSGIVRGREQKGIAPKPALGSVGLEARHVGLEARATQASHHRRGGLQLRADFNELQDVVTGDDADELPAIRHA